MRRLRPYPIAVFAGLTLLIWGNRVWLAWTDPTFGVTAKLGYSVPITCFVLAAIVTLFALWRGATGSAGFRALVSAFTGGTVGYWAIRLPVILLRHHPASFKVVHAVLAGVSVVVAVRAWRALPARNGRSPGAHTSPAPERTTHR